MNSSPTDIARYWHDSLAGQLLGKARRSAGDVEKMLKTGDLVDREGCVEPTIAQAAFKRRSNTKAPRKGSAPTKPIPAVFYPYVYKRAFRSGGKRAFGMPDFVLPIGIPGEIDEDAGFTPLEPLIARDILGPSSDGSLTLADISDYDALRNTMTPPTSVASNAQGGRECIEATAQFARRLHEELLEESLLGLEYVCQDHMLFAVGESLADTTASIRRTYGHIEKTQQVSSLFARFTSLGDVPLKKAPSDLLSTFGERLGAATDKHGLAEAQRVALGELMRLPEGQMMAVNGPPGTGKTTMVLSVVASMWIRAALSGEPLVILAASANNQAVTNILDAFAKDFATGENSHPRFCGRWLPDLHSFGAYLPAAARKVEARMQNRLTDEWHEAYASPDRLAQYRRFFLKKASAASKREFYLVEEAVSWLQAELTQVVRSIANTGETLYAAHGPEVGALEKELAQAEAQPLQAAKPVSLVDRLARLVGLSTSNVAAHDHNRAVLMRRDELASALDAARGRQRAAQDALRAQYGVEAISRAGVDNAVDTDDRFLAFLLATHYWEGRYILELEDLTRSPKLFENFQNDWLDQQEHRYRLWGMLTPCLVATFYSLPGRLSGAVRDSGKIFKQPMTGFADLLVVDEAGQAAPEIAGASFLLAKRALVIGDVDQIEPVWSAAMPVDKGDTWKNGIVRKRDEAHWEEVGAKGILASNGTVMRIAQRATPYWTEPGLQRGLYLYDHYRCWDEIIRFSNDLCYKGVLKPHRGSSPPSASTDDRPIAIPAIGYAHVDGRCEMGPGGRINRSEASAIAAWIAEIRPQIEQEGDAPINKQVAVVTPFRAQAQALRQALKRHGIATEGADMLVVGTTHALQGAERNIVLFSPCYTRHADGNFLDARPSLLNVAVSRARNAFLVFGDMTIFDEDGGKPRNYLARHLFRNGSEVPLGTAAPRRDLEMASDCSPILRGHEAHMACLLDVLAQARREVRIASPWIVTETMQKHGILDAISRATARGLSVKVYTDDHFGKGNLSRTRAARDALLGSGASVHVINGLHAKLLTRDDDLYVAGSLNWLSAHDTGRFARVEESIAYSGAAVKQEIETTWDHITRRTVG